ncbi:hypothetical protein ACFFMN_30945 [Planobispora siamensis]|uniref:Transmembrane protein n=1 Tax=Planobispora siamensis TaxID=936338 RepID=A0A8J3SBI1_9ACTN|nr:hypothetical protein [Planobispora siamensis]GIH91387.1 hypothetical protein Psi01_20170 [Planobispora siamensis]
MNDTSREADLSPEEAARALSGIRATQARAVRSTPWFPTWFVIGIGLSITLIQFAADPLTSLPLRVAGLVLAVAGITGCSIVIGRSGKMRTHKSVVEAGGLLGYFVWVIALVIFAVALALVLAALDIPYAATWACLAMTAVMGLTGPILARWISRRIADKLERGR